MRRVDEREQGLDRGDDLADRGSDAHDSPVERSGHHRVSQIALREPDQRARSFELRDEGVGVANRLTHLERRRQCALHSALRGVTRRARHIDLLGRDVAVR